MAGSYDDEWILAHRADYKYWSEMYEDYMKEHPNEDHTVGAFRQRTRKLGLNRNYTMEQDQWLKANYPALGAEQSYELFCKIFHVKKGYQGFKTHITELGLKVTEKRWREACQNNGHREKLPIGTITRRTRNTEWILTEDGWIPLQQHVLGKAPKGHRIIHLDGNGRNNKPDNLAVIDQTTSAMMSGNNFWSKEPEVTKTALIWCELNKEYRRKNNGSQISKLERTDHSPGKKKGHAFFGSDQKRQLSETDQ